MDAFKPAAFFRWTTPRRGPTSLTVCLLLALAGEFATSAPAEAGGSWRAGVAKANITPTETMWMAGYAGRNRPAEGKLTDLWAKALALADPAGKRAVLVTLDVIGLDRELGLGLRCQIAQRHGLRLSDVMICTSHTHSGPIVARNLRPMHWLMLSAAQQEQVSRYADRLEAAVLRAADEALARLAPASLATGSGKATFAVNRRNNAEAKILELQAAQAIVGPVDHAAPVLAVRDRAGGLSAIVFGYACHATVLDGYQWSGDYPGYAQEALEAAHPGAVAMFWAGCGGDQNPLPRRRVELAEKYGRELAAAVDAVLAQPMNPVTGALRTSGSEIALPLAALPSRAELEKQAADKDKYVVSRARYWLAVLDRGGHLPATYPFPAARWELGDRIEWLFLGGEVVVDYAVRLKSEGRDDNTWVAAYANDVMAYIPSLRVLREGRYEGGGAMVFYGLPSVWSEEVETKIAAQVKGLRNASGPAIGASITRARPAGLVARLRSRRFVRSGDGSRW